MKNILITLDIDWAPDFVIDWIADLLIKHQVKATWFVTHRSPAIERLRQYPNLFELGIHPNFLPSSTQGTTTKDILQYCLEIVPDAISMRTHGLFQSSPLLHQVITETNILIDVSLFLPHTPNILPIEYWSSGKKLLRIPYYWEDDFEMERSYPTWKLDLFSMKEGLKIFNFHPIHVYLNSTDMKSYTSLKQNITKLSEATPEMVDDFRQNQEGTQTTFQRIMTHLSKTNNSFLIRDIYQEYNLYSAKV